MSGMEMAEIIKSAFKASGIAKIHTALKDLLNELETNQIEDIINGGKIPSIVKTDSDISSLIQSVINHPVLSTEEKIGVMASLMKTTLNFLDTAVTIADVKSLLIFLSANAYLQINIVEILDRDEYEEYNFLPLSDKALEMVLRINVEIKTGPTTPHHEKKKVSESAKGFEMSDIKATYSFIEGLERNGRGFHHNFLLESLILFLYHLSFKHFLQAASALKMPNAIVFYLQSFGKGELNRLAVEPTLTYKWLNFELVRQILKKYANNSFDESDRIAVMTALEKMRAADFNFFKQTVRYFAKNGPFNTALGKLLAVSSNSEIAETISECFVLNMDAQLFEARNSFLLSFLSCSNQEQKKFVLEAVYQKWNLFCERLPRSDVPFLNNLLVTDFQNFIIEYYALLFTKENLILVLRDLILKIEYLESEWANSQSRQMTNFFLYYSRVLVCSEAFKRAGFNDKGLSDLFSELQLNLVLHARYLNEGSVDFVRKIGENLITNK